MVPLLVACPPTHAEAARLLQGFHAGEADGDPVLTWWLPWLAVEPAGEEAQPQHFDFPCGRGRRRA